RCRAAADAVEQRHHLRHRGHLHLPSADDPDRRADRDPGGHPPVAGHDLLERERDDHRPEHPGSADLRAQPRVPRRREEPQREDEGRDREQIEQIRCSRAHCESSGRFLNISSIRSVTTNPPTTFADASTTATNDRIRMNSPGCGVPMTMIAPTMTIPWIAFVPDMSGGCSSARTLEITSKPTTAARTRIVSSVTSCALMQAPPPSA